MAFRTPSDSQSPALGSQLGPWRLLECYDSGSFGLVFRVERVGHPEMGSFALKMAKYAEDPRFPREVALLRSVHHPSAPGFEDWGWYTSPTGERYPYLVMEWVEGPPLYRWALGRTSREVLQVLQQLASALAAAHALGALHRDVKGGNIRVTSEGRAVLLDWGAGYHPGAEPVTDSALPPGTSCYRSPEALRWGWAHRKEGTPYQAGPADDVYALGVTAYRMCTGTYPPQPEEHSGPPLRLLAPCERVTVSASLNRLVLDCLREDRHARPSAASLAVAFQAAAAEPEAMRPITPAPAAAKAQTPDPWQWHWPAWAGTAAVGLGSGLVAGFLVLLFVQCWRYGSEPTLRAPYPEVAERHQAPPLDTPDGGVVEDALTRVVEPRHPEDSVYALSLPMPKGPLPGQKKPPCSEYETPALGACWLVLKKKPPCGNGGYELDGDCVRASFDPPREPTSVDPQ